MELKKKVRIEVIVPAGACGCTFGRWMDRIWRIVMKYREKHQEQIDFFTKTSDSLRAQEFGISQGIIFNDQKIELNKLDRAIQQALSER